MALASNELDIDDYYNLSIPERISLDNWLRSLGGSPVHTRKLTLCRETQMVLAEEWVLTTDKRLTYNRKTHDVDVIVRELKYSEDPPLWKKILDD